MRPLRAILASLLLPALAACGGAPVSGEQRDATDLNPSGRPLKGPALYRPQGLPYTTNAFDPLYCRLNGPGASCSRATTGNPDAPPPAGGT